MGADRGHRRSDRVEADGPRRRGVSDRPQVGGGRRAKPATPHYVVCNADESEPGTFKDRVLMEHDPFARGRGDDDLRHRDRQRSAASSTSAASIRRRSAPSAMRHRAGAARPGCSARTSRARASRSTSRSAAAAAPTSAARRRRCSTRSRASAASRGRSRHFPRSSACSASPRWSTTSRRWSTCSTSSTRAARRGRRPARRDRPARGCSACRVTSRGPGLYEIECGRTLREAIELAGGVPDGRALQAILLGGAAGTFVGPTALDMPLSFEGARAANATLGSGVIMVFDETADLARHARRASPSSSSTSRCGQCVPCRVGTVRQLELLQRNRDRTAIREPSGLAC